MKRVLSMDISSRTIGWALFNIDEKINSAELIKVGHYKPPKKKTENDLSSRLSKTSKSIKELIESLSPNEIVVEDYAKRFSKGKSTAHVIIILSTFNELISLIGYDYLKAPVFRYPVANIRSVLGIFFNQKIISKDDIYPVIVAKCFKFKPKPNKKGNVAKESGDEADAIAVGITHIIKKYPNISIWNL